MLVRGKGENRGALLFQEAEQEQVRVLRSPASRGYFVAVWVRDDSKHREKREIRDILENNLPGLGEELAREGKDEGDNGVEDLGLVIQNNF